MEENKQLSGFRGFIIIWLGQIISILASSMTSFALSIWMFQQTQSATAMSFVIVSYTLPLLILSPIAGVMVDRYNRKQMMMVSDVVGGLGSVFLLGMFATGKLEFWHLYITAALGGVGAAFQWPAYAAVIGSMIPKEQLGRVNGLMSLMEAGPGLIAPFLAGVLLPFVKIEGVLIFDVVTFVLAVGLLSFIYIPSPRKTEEGQAAAGNIWREALFGFQYIFARPSLLGLQLVFLCANLFAGIGFAVFTPMILARTGQDSLLFGSVQTAFAVGAIAGGLLMSAWGGFKRRVHGVLGGWVLSGIGMLLFGAGQMLWVWLFAAVFSELFGPLLNGSNQALWQSKVAPDVQGRVFSARRLIAWFTTPITPIIGGTLADFVFEPAMRISDSFLPMTFGRLVGTGPGSGMGLLIFFCGIGVILVGLVAYFVPAVRNAEDILPDHDTLL